MNIRKQVFYEIWDEVKELREIIDELRGWKFTYTDYIAADKPLSKIEIILEAMEGAHGFKPSKRQVS